MISLGKFSLCNFCLFTVGLDRGSSSHLAIFSLEIGGMLAYTSLDVKSIQLLLTVKQNIQLYIDLVVLVKLQTNEMYIKYHVNCYCIYLYYLLQRQQ